ncbi:hypothetical protein EV360DRAFT_86925 [Lentinula raphanica]|nr:hypothetical protein EV360DRAFT_86925 [Lentinula raphanica]
MGIICRCALPDLFVPLSAINCNADYYHALCSGQEVGSPPTAAPNALSVDVTHIVPAPANALTLGLSNPVTPISPPATIATHNPALTTETSVVHVPDVMLNQPHVFLTEPDVNPKESGIQVESIFPYSSPRYLLADFGLAEGGAKVISGLTSPTEGLTSLSYAAGLIAVLRGYDKTQMHINPPLVVLEEQLSVSNCWRFGGSRGHIAISLSNTIIWTHYTLHFPDHLDASNRKLEQAPKILIMWALVMKSEVEVENLRFLTTWERYVTVKQLVDSSLFNSSSALLEVARILYNPSNGGEQTFLTQLPVETSTVLVEIVDNWGDTSTCLHRISFHSSN